LARLKNGNEFVTSRYWPEGRQILFDTYGGVFGIDKAFVTKIEASDKPLTPLAIIIEEPEVKRPSVPLKGSSNRSKSRFQSRRRARSIGPMIRSSMNSAR